MQNSIDVKIIKSEIPIIWIDTSIINLMTQWKFNLGKLDSIQAVRIKNLYNAIYDNARNGRLICPLAEQEGEVWVERDKWLDTIQSLSLGISTHVLYSIQNNQLQRFMKSYVDNTKEITLKYTDAFHSDPVRKLKDTLQRPFFITTKRDILFGKEYQKDLKSNLYQAMEKQRKENVKLKVTFKKQLEKEYVGELDALFILQKRFLSGQFKNENEQLNAITGTIDLNQQLMFWKRITGNVLDYDGLIKFYKSDHHRSMPFINISCNLYARIMTDKQAIRSGDLMDIKHAATLLPFSDLYITDKAMSTLLNKKDFNKLYNTTICYIGDTDVIDGFFSKL